MAGAIALAAALSRFVKFTCPWCKHVKLASREPRAFRVCPKCHKHFPDPRSSKSKQR